MCRPCTRVDSARQRDVGPRPAFGFAMRRAVDGDIGIVETGATDGGGGGGVVGTRRVGSVVILVFIGGGSTVTRRDGMKSRSGDSTQ